MGILSWIIFGLIAGILVKCIMRRKHGGEFHELFCWDSLAEVGESSALVLVW